MDKAFFNVPNKDDLIGISVIKVGVADFLIDFAISVYTIIRNVK